MLTKDFKQHCNEKQLNTSYRGKYERHIGNVKIGRINFYGVDKMQHKAYKILVTLF